MTGVSFCCESNGAERFIPLPDSKDLLFSGLIAKLRTISTDSYQITIEKFIKSFYHTDPLYTSTNSE